MKSLRLQIETALLAYATAKGATPSESPMGSTLIELPVGFTINLTEASKVVAKALKE